MSVYKFFPEKDATLYSAYPTQNTGLDEILEVSTTYLPDTPQVSRFLIQFAQTEINNFIDGTISGSVTDVTGSLLTSSKDFKADLRCFIADISGLNADTTLEVFPLHQSWNMGTGKTHDVPKTENGCSWQSGSNAWIVDPTALPGNVSSNYLDNNPGGAAWYSSTIDNMGTEIDVTGEQILSYANDKDIKVDITNPVKLMYSGSGVLANNGFIVKQSNADEFQSNKAKVANIKYFSIDTHTIYPPHLDIKWRDWTFNTGSSTTTIIDTEDLIASIDNNGMDFRRDSIQKFYINCRPQFPRRAFKTSSVYTTNYYLPTASYYAIKDLDTNEFIIDFDTNYTQISADDKGSYFKLYMNGLEPERYYQILVKTEINGSTLVLDDNYYFKVING